MDKPCEIHSIKEGNTIYYELSHLFRLIQNNKNIPIIEQKYPVKILQVRNLSNNRTIIKVEVKHNGEVNVDNFDNMKQMFFSDLNDEPMWKKLDDKCFNFILLYKPFYHNVEDKWEPFDY